MNLRSISSTTLKLDIQTQSSYSHLVSLLHDPKHQIKLSLERKEHCPYRLDTQKLFHIYPRHVGRSCFLFFNFLFQNIQKA